MYFLYNNIRRLVANRKIKTRRMASLRLNGSEFLNVMNVKFKSIYARCTFTLYLYIIMIYKRYKSKNSLV